jgi:multicomponent Na+:H+ antiporter subunit D
MLAGGAVSALFVGDLVSFVAAAAIAGLAAVWVVLASPAPGASGAGVRLLIWHGLEGLLFLAGVAFHLSAGEAKTHFALDAAGLGGGFIFAALMIRVGAPFAHVWLKDAVSHASGAGGAALTAFTTLFGVYALARMFPAEPSLVPIGAAMMAIGAIFSIAADDARRAVAYAQTAQTGVCVALIGLGAPLAQAGAAAHAFTTLFVFVLLQMALGSVVMRRGKARFSEFTGLAYAMPMSAGFLLIGGLAASALPGFSPYLSQALALGASMHWQQRYLWLGFTALSAVMMIAVALRPALAAFKRDLKSQPRDEAPFTMQLAAALAAFFCVAIGFNPGWLYGLLPPNGLNFSPLTLDRIAAQMEVLGAAGCVYVLARAFKLTPAERPVQLLDVDALYRGPVAFAGRWTGAVLLRLYGAIQSALDRGGARAGQYLSAWSRTWDQPYKSQLAAAAQLAAVAALLAIILIVRR